jgi:hypothetical protein
MSRWLIEARLPNIPLSHQYGQFVLPDRKTDCRLPETACNEPYDG